MMIRAIPAAIMVSAIVPFGVCRAHRRIRRYGRPIRDLRPLLTAPPQGPR